MELIHRSILNHQRCSGLAKVLNMLQQIELLPGSQNQVHPTLFHDLFRSELRVTADHRNAGCGRQALGPVHDLSKFPIGILGDRTGVDHVEISRIMKLGLGIACCFKLSRDHGCLGIIEFTAQGMKGDLFGILLHGAIIVSPCPGES